MSLEMYEELNREFSNGNALGADRDKLVEWLMLLSTKPEVNDNIRHRDIIRGITINHVLLQQHIDTLQNHITALDAKNSKLQRLVVALTIAAVIGTLAQTIGTGIQTYIAVQQYNPTAQQSQSTVSAPPQQATQSGTPTQAVAQSSGQAKKKTP